LSRTPAKKQKIRAAASPTPITTNQKAIKATRRRGELGDRVHELRSAAKSQKALCYAKRQRRESTAKAAKAAAERSRAASMARWNEHERLVEAAQGEFSDRSLVINLSMPVLLVAERAARAVPTSRRHPLLLRGGSRAPPPKDKGGVDLWGGAGWKT
jgi:hypothetical protein